MSVEAEVSPSDAIHEPKILGRPIRARSFMEPEVPNPFRHELNLPWYEYVKVGVMSVTVLPIRLVCFVGIMSSAWILALIATVGLPAMEDKPLGVWRTRTAKVIRFLGRAAFFVAGFHWITTKGKTPTRRETGLLVIAPHSSYLDVVVLFCLGAMPMPISRIENFGSPYIGGLLRLFQPIYVKREDPQSRQRTVAEINRRARGREEGWPPVCIFPEGTTTNRSCLINFKPGAFLPGLPVQPVVLRWPNRVDWITWTWQGHGVLFGLWLGLCQFHNYAEVEVLPVYHPSELELKDPQLFANNVRWEMAEALEIPMTDHSFEDCRLMILAKKYNLPMASGIVEFSKLRSKLGLDYEAIKGMLERFTEAAAHTPSKDRLPRSRQVPNSTNSSFHAHPTHLTLDDFANHLGLSVSPALKRVFDLYDRNRSGTIDFREYVIGLCLVSSPANTEETIKAAFNLFDREGKGYVSREDLATILGSAFSMSPVDSNKLFDLIVEGEQQHICYEDILAFSRTHPEYAKLFDIYINFDAERLQHTKRNFDSQSESEKKQS